MVEYKAVSGKTTAHLDSAKTFEEAKRDLRLLETSEAWCLKIVKIKKGKENE